MPPDRVVEEIKQRLDLVEYISRTVDLKRAGRTYKACCPFHAERTPSFVVFPHTGTWHCFGACGEGGDLFHYVQKREGLTFAEAVRQLAREAGVVLEEESDRTREAREARERLMALCEAAATFYQQALRDRPDAEACRAYCTGRGLSQETIFRFGLGYAPATWDALSSAMQGRGFTPEELIQVGLARAREGGGLYDWLRDRLIFPIRDGRGRTIAFGGRALHAEQQPKYINSPQTPLFDKGQTLYALDLARDAIRLRGQAVVVEGYMDAIAAHQAGATNVVATLGTAITADHLQLLNRYSPNLVLALDGDEAGQRAAERGLEAMRSARQQRRDEPRAGRVEGDVRVLVLPSGMDPDDLFRQQPERWEALVGGARPVLDFLFARRLADFDPDDAVQKARAAADLLPLVAELDNSLMRNHYLQLLARRLRSDERLLAQEMIRLGTGRPRPAPAAPVAPPPAPPDASGWTPMDAPPPPDEGWADEDFGALGSVPLAPPPAEPAAVADADPTESVAPGVEGYLLFLLIEHPTLLPRAVEAGLTPLLWEQPDYREIAATLLRVAPASAAHLEEFLEELEPLLRRTVRALIAHFAPQPSLPAEEVEGELLRQLGRSFIRYDERRERQVQWLLDDLQREENPDPDLRRALLQQRLADGQRRLSRQRELHARLQPQHPARRS